MHLLNPVKLKVEGYSFTSIQVTCQNHQINSSPYTSKQTNYLNPCTEKQKKIWNGFITTTPKPKGSLSWIWGPRQNITVWVPIQLHIPGSSLRFLSSRSQSCVQFFYIFHAAYMLYTRNSNSRLARYGKNWKSHMELSELCGGYIYFYLGYFNYKF